VKTNTRSKLPGYTQVTTSTPDRSFVKNELTDFDGVASRTNNRHNPRMPERIGWTRDQLLIALRLYMRTPFGKLHGRNPDILSLAPRIGRTPSALAMKACNFAGLDPAFLQTNRRGLSGASESDRSIWTEFTSNAERLAAEAEDAFARLDPARAAQEEADIRIPVGETDVARVVRARRVQSFFRAAVLTSYNSRCAISGIALPELLVASHIMPWADSVERRADPRNGLCLNALFDRAFDRGLITVDADLRVVVSRRLKEGTRSAELACSLGEVEGRRLMVPSRFPPATDALEHHRDRIFEGN
jgi:putative restriction endonuclease